MWITVYNASQKQLGSSFYARHTRRFGKFNKVVSTLAERQWRPSSWDLETALPQGNLIQRDIYLNHPPENLMAGLYFRPCKPLY
jgi:hypothetical protein